MDQLLEIFYWIINNWNTVAIATVILSFLTGLLTYFTLVLAREAKKTREQNTSPNVVVTIEPYERSVNHAFLIIENVGKGTAYEVEINESENYTFNDNGREYVLNDLQVIKLKILKPNQKMEHHLGTFESLPSKCFEFNVSCKSVDERLIKNSNYVDVNSYYDRRTFNEKTISDLVQSAEKISTSLRDISNKISRNT